MNLSLYQKKRKQLKLTYDQLAEMSGVSKRTIAGIFSGDENYQNPNISTVEAIEKALGITKDTAKWTDEDRAQGVTDTAQRNVTPEEDDLLTLYREIGQKKGANAQALARKLLEQIKEN